MPELSNLGGWDLQDLWAHFTLLIFIPDFKVPIQLWVWSKLQGARFSPLHVGIALDAKILFEEGGKVTQVIRNILKIMHEWGTRREWIDGKWVIFMKGKPLKAGESLTYGQILVGG